MQQLTKWGLILGLVPVTSAAFAETMPLSVATVEEKSSQPGVHRHFQNGFLEFDFATRSGKLKLRKLGDRVYWDSNQDGTVDSRDIGTPSLSVLSIPLKIGTRTWQYPIHIKLSKEKCIDLTGLLFLQASYHGQTIRIIDRNVDGKFTIDKKDEIQFGTAGRIPLTELLITGNQIYQVKTSQDSSVLTLTESRSMPATIHLKSSHKQWTPAVTLVHEGSGHSLKVTTQAPVQTIPGKYWIHAAETILQRTGQPAVRIGAGGQKQYLSRPVAPGSNTLIFSQPVRMSFQIQPDRNDWRKMKLSRFRCFGNAGESYNLPPGGKAGKKTLTSFIRSGTKEVRLSQLERC